MGAFPCGCNFTSTDKIVIFAEISQSSDMLSTHLKEHREKRLTLMH